MKIEKWLKINTADLSGKTVAITGSTGGLGRELCEYFAKLNAKLLMLNRNETKTTALVQSLAEKYPSLQVDFVQVDQADFGSLQKACIQLQERQIDFLVLNAGAYNISTYTTDLGINNIFQINFFSPYYLVKSLLPTLRKCHTKVVVVSSLSCNFAKFDEDDFDYSSRNAASKVYGNAKRWLTYSLLELLRAELDVSLSITHPGVTGTDMLGHYPKAINWFVKSASKVVFSSPHKASLCVLRGCFEKCAYLEWIGPSIFGIWGLPRKSSLKKCPEQERIKIFAAAESLCCEISQKYQ